MSEHSLDFLTRFALTAFLGSAVIVAGAPFVRISMDQTLPDELVEPSRALRAHPQLASAAAELERWLLWSPPKRAAVAEPPTASPHAPSPHPTGAGRFAIVRAEQVALYDAGGRITRRIPAGTVLRILDSMRTEAGGTRLECVPLEAGHPVGDPFTVPAEMVNLYRGNLEQVTAPDLELRRQYGRLQGQLDRLQRAPAGMDRHDNPYFAPYDAARTTFRAFQAKDAQLIKQSAASTGDDRIQVLEEMRSRRGDGLQLEQTYKAAKARYDAWNANHPAVKEAPSSPQMLALTAQIAHLEAQIRAPSRAP